MTQIISFFSEIRKGWDSQNLFAFACMLVVAALPFSIAFTTYSTLLLAVVWLFQNNFKCLIETLRGDKILWVFCSLYLLMIIALGYTNDINSGMWELEKGSSLLVFPFLLSSAKRITTEKIHLILKVFILSNICFGVISLAYATYIYFTKGTNIFFYHDLVTPLFDSHATYYSVYIIFSSVAAFLFYLKIENPSLLIKIIAGSIFIFFSVLIYLLSIRSIVILYTVSVMAAIVFFIIKSKNYKLGFVTIVGFIALVFVVMKYNPALREKLWQIVENHNFKMSAETMEGYNGLTTRLAQWESSVSIIKEHPIIGVAPADVQDELQEVYKKNFLKYCYANKWNAHNQYIQTTLGLGVVGLVAFVGSLAITGWIACKTRNVLGLAFVALFAFCSITESTLCVHKGIVFYSFFQALFVFHLFKNSPDQKMD